MPSSFCWSCGGVLRKNSKGDLIFKIVNDPLGNPHRVHIGDACVHNAMTSQRQDAHLAYRDEIERLELNPRLRSIDDWGSNDFTYYMNELDSR